jgi:hypothetical protein
MKFGRVGIENDKCSGQHENRSQDGFKGYEISTPEMEKSKTEKYFGGGDQACVSGTRITEAQKDQRIIEDTEKECSP